MVTSSGGEKVAPWQSAPLDSLVFRHRCRSEKGEPTANHPNPSCPFAILKKVKMDAGDDEQEVIGTLSVIAQPLAGKKLTKKLLKVVKKAAASKILRRGVKEVVKVLRKADGKFKGWVFASCAMAGWCWYCWTCHPIFFSHMWESLPCDRPHMPHRPQASASPF